MIENEVNIVSVDNNLIFEQKLNKAKSRRKRYEDSTLNKPITVRAHPDKHELIKKYAKTGFCCNCKIMNRKQKVLTAMLNQRISSVKWNDEFTERDATLTFYTVVLSL